MSSSEAFLGAFQNPAEITVTFNREMLEEAFQTLAYDDDVTVSEEQWKQVFDAVFKSDLVADFIYNLVDLAQETLTENN